jgi:hypothetical protein
VGISPTSLLPQPGHLIRFSEINKKKFISSGFGICQKNPHLYLRDCGNPDPATLTNAAFGIGCCKLLAGGLQKKERLR